MGRLKSLASATQYITLDKEFRIGNCFPLHAQIAIKNNKCHPSMSLSVFLYQFLYSHLHPHHPHRHYTVHLSSCHPHRSPSSSFLLPISLYICLSSSPTSIPINFCVGCLFIIGIHQSLPLPPPPLLSPDTRIVFFQTNGTLSPFSLRPVKKWNYRFLMKGGGEHRTQCLSASQRIITDR